MKKRRIFAFLRYVDKMRKPIKFIIELGIIY